MQKYKHRPWSPLFFPELVAAADRQNLSEKETVEIPIGVVGHDRVGKKMVGVEVLPVYLPAFDDQVGFLGTFPLGALLLYFFISTKVIVIRFPFDY